MKELTIVKDQNDVMDVSIAYGLLSILRENGVQAILKHYPAAYIIEAEDYDASTFELYQNAADENARFNCMVSNADRLTLLKKLFGKDDNPGTLEKDGRMNALFSYFETLNEDIWKEYGLKNTNMTYVGSGFDTKGQRGHGVPRTRNVPELIRYTAALGYLRASSFLTINDNDEYSWLPIPSQQGVTDIVQMDIGTKVDAETGEMKRITYLSENSVLTGLAHVLLKLQSTLMKENMLERYDGVITLQTLKAGQRGLNGKIEQFTWLPLNEQVIHNWLKRMSFRGSDKQYDWKHALSCFIVFRNKEDFGQYTRIAAKEQKRHLHKEAEDCMNMIGLTELYENQGIKTAGKRLNQLLYRKKGYEVQATLMNATTKNEVMRGITLMAHIYKRTMGYSFWEEADVNAMMKTIDNPLYQGTDIASAILLASNTWKKEELTETEEEAGHE